MNGSTAPKVGGLSTSSPYVPWLGRLASGGTGEGLWNILVAPRLGRLLRRGRESHGSDHAIEPDPYPRGDLGM